MFRHSSAPHGRLLRGREGGGYRAAAALVIGALIVGGCAAPGTQSAAPAASTAASAAPSAAATASVAASASTEASASAGASAAGSASASASAGASTAAGPDCGTEPVVLNAYFETGFDIPFKLSEEFTKQFPNVTFDIKQDQFTNLMSSTPRLLSGDNPPDLIRLPSMVSLVKDGLLKNLDELRHGVRMGQVARLAARPEPGRHRRHPWRRLAVRGGPELQPHRGLLQQEARRPDRDDRAAEDASLSSRTCSPRPRRPVCSRSCSGTQRPAVPAWPSRCSS